MHASSVRRVGGFTLVFALGAAAVACSETAAPRGPRPASVSVGAATLHGGFALGTGRKDHEVRPFRITESPITVRAYMGCVAAGACAMPGARWEPDAKTAEPGPGAGKSILERATYGMPGADDLPVTRVSGDEATRMCRFLGGRLPTLEEWQLAARGPDVRRRATGDGDTYCDTLAGSDFARDRMCCAQGECADVGWAKVGTRAGGRSPSGLADVLLTPGELIAASPGSGVEICRGEGYCAVSGIEPGSIDFVARAPKSRGPAASHGFRCVFEEG